MPKKNQDRSFSCSFGYVAFYVACQKTIKNAAKAMLVQVPYPPFFSVCNPGNRKFSRVFSWLRLTLTTFDDVRYVAFYVAFYVAYTRR